MLIPDTVQRQMAAELTPVLMTAKEVANILLVSQKFVYSLAKRGRLTPAIDTSKRGGCMLWLDCDVKAYMVRKVEEGY